MYFDDWRRHVSLSYAYASHVALHNMPGRSMMPDLPGLLLHTAQFWLYQTSVCEDCSGLGWAVIICLGMWVAGLKCPGLRGFAMFVMLASQAMHTTLSWNVEACSTFVRDCLGSLDNMLRQCFGSCGR